MRAATADAAAGLATQLLFVKCFQELFLAVHAVEWNERINNVICMLNFVLGDQIKLFFGIRLQSINFFKKLILVFV